MQRSFQPNFILDPIRNDGGLGFFKDGRPNNNKNKKSNDMRSVPDLKINLAYNRQTSDTVKVNTCKKIIV